MQTIVINTTSGCLVLSPNGMRRFCELKRMEVKGYIYKNGKHVQVKCLGKIPKNKWGEINYEDGSGNKLQSFEFGRDDPALITVLQELGEQAYAAEYCKLEIVNIPDGIKWEVEEYDRGTNADGIEWIREIGGKRRLWRYYQAQKEISRIEDEYHRNTPW